MHLITSLIIVLNRINATSNIAKITATMKMVSASKLQKDQSRLEKGGPYNVCFSVFFTLLFAFLSFLLALSMHIKHSNILFMGILPSILGLDRTNYGRTPRARRIESWRYSRQLSFCAYYLRYTHHVLFIIHSFCHGIFYVMYLYLPCARSRSLWWCKLSHLPTLEGFSFMFLLFRVLPINFFFSLFLYPSCMLIYFKTCISYTTL